MKRKLVPILYPVIYGEGIGLERGTHSMGWPPFLKISLHVRQCLLFLEKLVLTPIGKTCV